MILSHSQLYCMIRNSRELNVSVFVTNAQSSLDSRSIRTEIKDHLWSIDHSLRNTVIGIEDCFVESRHYRSRSLIDFSTAKSTSLIISVLHNAKQNLLLYFTSREHGLRIRKVRKYTHFLLVSKGRCRMER